jgi:hypothetical protein
VWLSLNIFNKECRHYLLDWGFPARHSMCECLTFSFSFEL